MKRAFGLLIVGLTIGLAGLVYGCVPVAQRLTSPVVCPGDTVESVVVAYSTRSGSSSSFHTELHCIDPDGGGYEAPGAKIFFTLFGYAAGVVGLGYLGFRLRRRSTKVAA